MASTRPTLLRLRQTTVDKLRVAVAGSVHRSMATLADEILDAELDKRLKKQEKVQKAKLDDEGIDKMMEAMRRGQQP